MERDHDLAREFFSIREGGETENEDEEEDEENPHQTLFIRRIRAEQVRIIEFGCLYYIDCFNFATETQYLNSLGIE